MIFFLTIFRVLFSFFFGSLSNFFACSMLIYAVLVNVLSWQNKFINKHGGTNTQQ